MRFEIKENDYGVCVIVDTLNAECIIEEFENKWDAEVLQEMLNDAYNEGFEDGKDHILNNGDF